VTEAEVVQNWQFISTVKPMEGGTVDPNQKNSYLCLNTKNDRWSVREEREEGWERHRCNGDMVDREKQEKIDK